MAIHTFDLFETVLNLVGLFEKQIRLHILTFLTVSMNNILTVKSSDQ